MPLTLQAARGGPALPHPQPQPRPPGIIFDFDGTILDTEHSVYQSWVDLWARHGQELDRTWWQSTIGHPEDRDPWAELEHRLRKSLPPEDAEWRVRRRDELQAREAPRAGILTWLDTALELDVPLGVASSSSHRWVHGHLERLGLRHHFGCLITRDSGLPGKPDPAPFRVACEHLGIDPAVSVAVEDSPPGVASATSAGLFTVAVPHPLTADLDLSPADLRVGSLAGVSLADTLARATTRHSR